VTRRTSAAALLMLTTIAMTRGAPSPAAEWSETLGASANVAYDTNPRLLPGVSVSDRSAQLAVDGNTQLATELSQLTVTPRLAIIRYDQDRNLDNTAASVAVAFQDKGERGQWSLSGLAQTDSTLNSELGQTGVTEVNFRHDGYNASAGYSYLATERLSWLVQGSGQITQYNAAAEPYGLVGYRYGGVLFGPTWSFSDRLQGSLDLQADEVRSQSGTTERDYSANTQLKRNLSEQYSWRISAGATRVAAQGNSASPTTGVFEIGLTRATERVQWDLSIKRAVLPIGFGFLARQDVAAVSAVVAVSERSTLNLACNVIRTEPVSLSFYLAPGISIGYQIYDGAAWGQAAAEWQYHLSPRWMLSAAYLEARARNYSVPQWANGTQARLSVTWESGRL